MPTVKLDPEFGTVELPEDSACACRRGPKHGVAPPPDLQPPAATPDE